MLDSTNSQRYFVPIEIRPLPHLDFQAGYNGVPATSPRIVGLVNVRSKEMLQPLSVECVSIEFRQEEIITFPSLGLGTQINNERCIASKTLFPPPPGTAVFGQSKESLCETPTEAGIPNSLNPSRTQSQSQVHDIVKSYGGPVVDNEIALRSQSQFPRPCTSASSSISTDYVNSPSDIFNNALPSSFTRPAKVWSMDLPFELELPKNENLPASFELAHSGTSVCTKYFLRATLCLCGISPISISVPVKLDRFDMLSSWGMFNKAITLKEESSDGLVSVDVSIPKSCIVPLDLVTVFLSIVPLSAHHIRVQRVSLVLLEQLMINVPKDMKVIRRRKVLQHEEDLVDQKLANEGLSLTLSCLFEGRSQQSSTLFTTCSEQYRVDYLLIVKVELFRARDVEIIHPVVVSSVERTRSGALLNDIQSRVLEVRQSSNATVLDGSIVVIPASCSVQNKFFHYVDGHPTLME
ncbi:arrestin family protein [Schizosaccharomyces japonicus yFS275]|uniref:Arrestin family protein n=1 Tax=Schizosaccharomyces japonicus (strain yFS275 / FY16936) TaxID=402676 RepID=B6K1V5_SCHJY|nr:arrestin family protein [Schizosaccharomyces japonicus yFS275]EEB07136.1 arrestin family protein [Schizosaccharomyces japonicus yFS275]